MRWRACPASARHRKRPVRTVKRPLPFIDQQPVRPRERAEQKVRVAVGVEVGKGDHVVVLTEILALRPQLGRA